MRQPKRRELFNYDKPHKLITTGNNIGVYTLTITGGHYTIGELRDLYPDGYDDLDMLRVLRHGYMRHEFIPEFDREDDEQTHGYYWYDKPVKGFVSKATEVLVRVKEEYG